MDGQPRCSRCRYSRVRISSSRLLVRRNSNASGPLRVEPGGRCGGRDHEVHLPVVELVDEADETPRPIPIPRPDDRHVGEQHGVKAARDLDVVGRSARAVAELVEAEPRDPLRAAHRRDRPAENHERPVFLPAVRHQRLEAGFDARGRPGAEGGVIDVRAFEGAQAVVLAPRELEHAEAVLELRDGGKEAIALEPSLVQPGGRDVGGGDEGRSPLEQTPEQAPEDHGVGDVADVELVEAQHPDIGRPVRRDHPERVLDAPPTVTLERLVHAAHEAVEVGTALGHALHPPRRSRP